MRRLALLAGLCVLGLAEVARAQTPTDTPPPTETVPPADEARSAEPVETPTATAPPAPLVPANALPPRADAPTMWIDRNLSRSWETGGPRPFFSAMVDVGYLYLRPRVALGYGRPFHRWIGLEANPSVSSNVFGSYGGIRVDLPYFDIRMGARYNMSFQRSYLRPDDSYDRYELESTALGRSRAVALETEANLTLPAGPGTILGLGSVSYITNVPANQLVYEETLRLIVQPPWVLRTRWGYVFGFGAHQQFSIGPVVDFLDVPERKSFVLRAGALVRFVLSRSFEIRGSFVPRIFSQDELGLLESDFTELGLRWRWATASD